MIVTCVKRECRRLGIWILLKKWDCTVNGQMCCGFKFSVFKTVLYWVSYYIYFFWS
jgi:hypothetical protein